MPDIELAGLLKQAKTKPVFFAWILKGGGDGRLMLSKTKIPMKDVLDVKKEIGGDKPITGKCSGPLDDMIFQTGGMWPGVTENVIPKVVKRDAGLSISVTMNIMGKDKELLEDDKEMGKEDAKIPPPLPVPQIGVSAGAEQDQLMTLAQILDSIKPMKGNFPDGPRYNITIKMRDYELSEKEVQANRKNAQTAFAKGSQKVIQHGKDAMEFYSEYRKTMTKGWFGTAATWVFDKVSVTDPEDRMNELVNTSVKRVQKALTEAMANSFVDAAGDLVAADTAASQANHLIWAYKNGLERSAGTTVKVLEGVKTTCEITLAVGGAVVTGGGTIAAAGSIGMTTADTLSHWAVGDKVDWKKFAFKVTLELVAKGLGGSEKIEAAMAEKLAGKLGSKGAEEAIAKITGGSVESLMKNSLEKTRDKLSGEDVTYEKVVADAKKEALTEIAVGIASILKK